MNKYKCIIIDDEPLAIQVILSHAARIGSLEIAGTFSNAIEATEVLARDNIDLMFLDIQMPGMKGTDFLKTIKDAPRTILTTAYREYAIEGYELDVVDYLLKPISFDRFFKAYQKFLKEISRQIPQPVSAEKSPHDNEFIFLNINKKIFKIYLQDIQYIESLRDYISIHTLSGKYIMKHTLAAFQEKLPENEFIRIHRSFLISLRHIKSFTSQSVQIANIDIPVGKIFQAELFRALKYPGFPPSED